MEKAIFGAGCFWGVEASFRKVPGVIDVACGYSGGNMENPTYEFICTGMTDHAEVVEVTFDPDTITFEKLLDVFWKIHDPTQVNRQGPDSGTQYRSAIFTLSPQQHTTAESSKKALDNSGTLPAPVATEITEAGPFWRAEEYHQRYFEQRGIAH